MKVTVLLLALASAFTLAADNAVTAPRAVTGLKPQAASYGAEVIAIPQMLSYQGMLTDTFGVPVADTAYSVEFRLYSVPTGGSPFWNETQTVRTRTGLFSTLLGSDTPISSMPDVGAAYLGMAVAGGTELAPRLRIVSAAYAFLTARAADADLLQGKDTTGLDARYVNEGQANSVTGAMLVDGTVLTTDVGDTAVTMAKIARAGATTGQVVKWTGSAWAPGQDNTGGGSGVTDVYQDTGIICVPNPITSTGNVKLDLGYGDARYVNEAQANSVTGAMITDGQVSSADIRDTTVNTAELKDNAVTSAKILDAAVTSADIRDTTVNTADLKDAAVTAPKLNQMGASSGQVLKWTGSAWAPRNDSGGGPIRGGDIVKPCTLAASVAAMGGVLHVSNTGNGFAIRVDTSGGHGVFVNEAQGSGFYTSRTTNGLGVYRALSNGVDVDSAGSAGVNVTRAGSDGLRVRRALDGVHVDTATQYGLNVQQANTHGVLISNANNVGLYVQRVGLDGVEVWRTPYNGVYVDSAGVAGIRVHRAVNGVLADTVQYGLNVQRATAHGVMVKSAGQVGLYVERAALDGAEFLRSGYMGVLVDSAGWDGVRVNRADSTGFRVRRAKFRGLQVDTADNDGVNITRTGFSGAYVGTAGTRGVWVDSSGGDGVFVNRAGSNGVYVHRAHGYGVRVDTASNSGVYVDRVSGSGLEAHYAGFAGLEVDTVGLYGVLVRYSNYVGFEATANNFAFRGSGNVAGGHFSASTTSGIGLEAHALGDTATKTAIKAYGKGLATGGWSTGFKDGSEAPCVIAADRTILAAGSGKLAAGAAAISYPAVFSEHIRADVPVRISVTPRGDPAGLVCVRGTGQDGFGVVMKQIPGLAGETDVAFDWVAVGTLQEPTDGISRKD